MLFTISLKKIGLVHSLDSSLSFVVNLVPKCKDILRINISRPC